MKKILRISSLLLLAAIVGVGLRYYWGTHIRWNDFKNYTTQAGPIGVLEGSPLERLGIRTEDLRETVPGATVRFLGRTRYLNNARSVVTHTIDDSNQFVPTCLDAMDKYGIKATVFVSTEVEIIDQLWPRLRRAVANGHEIGSHSRRHQCQWPDTFLFCFRAYTDYEINGSREDILTHADQTYVWSWAYPCGNCAGFEFVHRKLARAGYLAARTYPGEVDDKHNLPDLQTYARNPYDAAYTQVVQKRGGIARTGRTDMAALNATFDQVHRRGGIYYFLSHPAWLDYGADKFYELHLDHIGKRPNVWYVPMGPLYAYRRVANETQVQMLAPRGTKARFAVYNQLDPRGYPNSITFEFAVIGVVEVSAGGDTLEEGGQGPPDRWDAQYVRRAGDQIFVTVKPSTILEFR